MNNFHLRRREFLRLGLIFSLWGLSSCGLASNSKVIVGAKDALPKELLKYLPNPWTFQELKIQSETDPYNLGLNKGTDFLILDDGWLSSLAYEYSFRLEFEKLLPRLGNKANLFLNNLGEKFHQKVFPVGTSPWVILFRNGEEFLLDAEESWEVLFSKKLKKEIVFPNSPRLLISIADKIGTGNDLFKLKEQIKAFGDRNALSWLTSGEAKAVVLPLNRCRGALFRDPRLSVALPRQGAPLNWTLMLKTNSSETLFPYGWFKNAWETSSLGELLSQGFFPPLEYFEFVKAKNYIPKRFQSVFLPDESIWNNCWSLPIITSASQRDLIRRWNN